MCVCVISFIVIIIDKLYTYIVILELTILPSILLLWVEDLPIELVLLALDNSLVCIEELLIIWNWQSP